MALGNTMNIDDLVNSIPEAELREQMIQLILQWKKDERDVDWLSNMFRKWHGNVWFKDNDESKQFLTRFQEFRSTAIEGIGGLTLNERLYLFGLFEEWDLANEAEQNRIRNKLHANA